MIQDLLPQLYTSPTAGWTAFLEAFRQKFSAAQALLTLVDYRSGKLCAVVHSAGITDEQEATYRRNWLSQDPWVTRVDDDTPLGQVRYSHLLCPDKQLEALPVYKEFLSLHGWHYGAGVSVVAEAGLTGTLSFSRPKKKGKVTKEEGKLLRALQPHVTAVLQLDLRLRSLEVIARFSDRLPYGLALLDNENRVVHANSSAQQLLPKLQLEAISSQYVRSLRCWVVVRRFEGPPPGTEICLLQPDMRWDADLAQLREIFGLTPSEARVTTLLCGGRTLSEVAKEAKITFETARTHLKRVLAKTHCRRQQELVALVLRLVKNNG